MCERLRPPDVLDRSPFYFRSTSSLKTWILPTKIDRRVKGAAEVLNLTDYLDRRPGQLSGGQRQRVAMGRAIVRHPDVFLFDEPLSNLDAELRLQMRVEISNLHAELGNTVIMITHDVDEAVLLSDRIVMMTNGPAATIGEILDIELERPRGRVELADSPEYNHYRAAVLKFLYERQRRQDEADAEAANEADEAASNIERDKPLKVVAGNEAA